LIEGVIKKLMASMKCAVCGQHYGVDSVDVLGHEEDLWFLRVVCSACHTQFLVVAIVREGKVPEVITDLTEAELAKFRNVGMITADEVLDIHNFLKDFDGDFSQLFGQKRCEI